jgi:hypothetical protein
MDGETLQWMLAMSMGVPFATIQLSRSVTIARHEKIRTQQEFTQSTHPYQIKTTAIDAKSFGYCDKPVDSLKPIKIDELVVDKVHVGR